MYYMTVALAFIILIMICLLIEQKRKYDMEITKKNREISSIRDDYTYYRNEYEKMKDVVDINYEVSKINDIEPLDKIKYNPIYKGKKALIGDYLTYSYDITKKVLENLGFEVTVSLSSAEVVKRIKNNEKYDIIFSNNIYRDGTGQECLAKLKEIEGFCTPVVIHTVTKNAKYHFVNEVGFDDYIEKPITQAKILPILEKLLPLGGENDT